jgi:hypothetical protein
MLRSALRVASVAGALLLLAACGDSSSSAANGTNSEDQHSPSPSPVQHVASVDACSLITADEASKATGATLTNLAGTGGVSIPGACIYGASESSASVFVYAQVYADASAANAVQADQIAAALAGRIAFSDAHPVSGIGDKALEYTATGSGGSGLAMFVIKANAVILLSVNPDTDSSVIENLARGALSRLVYS